MYKRSLTLLALLSLVSAAQAATKKTPAVIPEHQIPVKVGTAGLHDGAPIPLSLVTKLEVKKAKPGDQVEFRVADDVRWRDQIVIAKGTVAIANVTEAHGAKWPSRGSALVLALQSVKAVDGKEVPIRAAVNLKGGMNKVAGAAWALTGGTREMGLFFAPAAIVLSLTTKGHNENAPSGMHLLASVDGEFPVVDARLPNTSASKEPGIVWIGLAPEFYRAILFCNGSAVSRIDKKRVLRLELPAGYYRFGIRKEVSAEIYVLPGQEHMLMVNFTNIAQVPAEWSEELKHRKPEKSEHMFDTAAMCAPLPEQSAPKELLPEVIKPDVLIHQPGAAGNEVGDVSKQ